MNDRLIRGTMLSGQARFVLVRTDDVCAHICKSHGASNVCTAALGRLVSAATIMASSLKDENASLTLMIQGGGPAGQLIAIAKPGGRVKAYASNPYEELPVRESDGKLDVGGFVGNNGFVTVIRRDGGAETYIGKTELVSGEIGEDIAAYYTESEQTPTALAVGVRISPQGEVLSSGGLMIQLMPDASEAAIMLIEDALAAAGPVSAWINEEEDLTELIQKKMTYLDPEILGWENVTYHCDCEQNMPAAIATMGRTEAYAALEETGKIEVRCNFCNIVRSYDKAEVENILGSMGK